MIELNEAEVRAFRAPACWARLSENERGQAWVASRLLR